MSQFEEITRDINGISMNQCAMAQNMVNGLFGKLSTSNKLSCMTRSNSGKRNDDLFASHSKCQDDSSQYKDSGDDETKNLLDNQYNLAWKALTENKAIEDQYFLELMMSISGTILSTIENNRIKLIYKPSLFRDEKQIENFIGGASDTVIQIYKCNESTNCLIPTNQNITQKFDNSFYGKISKIISSITEKILEDIPEFSKEESNLISFSTIPIIPFIEQDLIIRNGNSQVSSELIEILCYDIVVGYLNGILNQISTSIENLEMAQIDTSTFKTLKKDIDRIRIIFDKQRITAFQRTNIVMQTKENMKLNNNFIKDRFSRILAIGQ